MSRAQFPDGKHRRPGCRPGSGSGACVRVQQSPPGVTAAHALGIPAPLKHPPNQRSMLQLRSAKHRLVLKRSDVAVSLRRLAARAADRLPLRLRRPASGAHLRSVDALSHTGRTDVDRYWSGHTVRARASPRRGNRSAFSSGALTSIRFSASSQDSGEITTARSFLDYGCGPGNDLVGLRAPHGRATDRGDRRVPDGRSSWQRTAGTSPDRPGPCRAGVGDRRRRRAPARGRLGRLRPEPGRPSPHERS